MRVQARIFNETPLNPRRCAQVLTKILYLLNQGEQLGTTEATEAFFAMTKLFQSKDPVLRRLVYLGIKELSTVAEDVIIVTSSLTKDMTGKEDQYRGAAIRALCKITDASMLQAIERYMKQAIVDKNHSVASAALVSSQHMMKVSHEVVKRWVNEAQEAINSDNIMVQYHALGLLYQIRKADPLAVIKLLNKYTHSSLRSPFAMGMLLLLHTYLTVDGWCRPDSKLLEFIESCLRHKSELVVYEAAHAIVNLKTTQSRELAVSVLQIFCSSPKPTLRFAAVRTLNKVAMSHPAAVTACNLDLENLITDVNRSIATLAITTLLKTGSESSVERLMKQITSFMSEISDEFKIVVVEAIRSLCQKFPGKHTVMMTFLSSMLREEGGFEYKRAIVNTIINILEDNPDSKEAGSYLFLCLICRERSKTRVCPGLAHLCEFIEDCEHVSLGVRILHLLGKEGPHASQPAKYIRFIYNRLILERAPVRAAAVSSLAKFGAQCPSLRPNITVLLQRCLLDPDDEVRDRAVYYLTLLGCGNPSSLNNYVIQSNLQLSVTALEKALHHYTLEPTPIPFDMKSMPVAAPSIAEEKKKSGTPHCFPDFASTETIPMGKPQEKILTSKQDTYIDQLAAVPALSNLPLGPLFKSSKPLELTEVETEYVVSCVKHTFSNHIVFQFDCTNTLADQVLEDVRVQMDSTEPGFDTLCTVPCPRLSYNSPGVAYTVVQLPPADPLPFVASTFNCVLKYLVKDCDPTTGEPDDDEGYQDEYVLEDLELSISDHIQRVLKTSFQAAWEELGPNNELEDTYALASTKTIQDAVSNVVQFLGLQPCERSDKVGEGRSSHTLLLAGLFRGGVEVLVRVKLAATADNSVTMNMAVRAASPAVSELLVSSIG
ncbi:COPG1 [Cordylochernes scorpioides]|uniref:Coatomer subunit gamma n=1 Tax=Cordylochernes scorpioides TaxID=51811 RepID=A0ABY6K669_9ARAC|nr:COPG1 [Cordylochernes scorpioides]